MLAWLDGPKSEARLSVASSVNDPLNSSLGAGLVGTEVSGGSLRDKSGQSNVSP